MSEESPTAKVRRLSAEKLAGKQRANLERSDAVLAEEDGRRAADATKTTKLRELRLAKEAAERVAAPKAKQKPQAKGRK